jgi:hypothetical protein
MPRYSLFGVTLESEWELSGLVAAEGPVCASIGAAAFARPDRPEGGIQRLWVENELAFIYDPSAGWIRIAAGVEILVQRFDGVDWSAFEPWLIGPAMAILLHQRGRLVLHASSVARDGRAIAFLGDCGAGKSVAALGMSALGWRLVADDQAVVDCQANPPAIAPGRPALSLARCVLPSAGHFREPHLPGGKLLVPSGNPIARETVLSRLYVLADSEVVRCTELTQPDIFTGLIRYSFLGPALISPRARRHHFEQCAFLASRLAMSRLERPRSLERLPEMARAVHDDIFQQRHSESGAGAR